MGRATHLSVHRQRDHNACRKTSVGFGSIYRDVFAEAWHLVGEDMEACLFHGRTVVREDVQIPIRQDGRMEVHYWTYTLLPIYEGGKIAGVYDPYQNTASRVLIARERDAAISQLTQFMSVTTDLVVGVNRDWEILVHESGSGKNLQQGTPAHRKRLWDEFPDAVYEGSPYVKNYERAMRYSSFLEKAD